MARYTRHMHTPFSLSLKVLRGRFWRREYLSALLVFTGGLVTWHGLSQLSETQVQAQPAQAGQEPDISEVQVPTIVIEVAGAVEKPGVQHVAATTRVGEVLERAGGISSDADTTFVARELKLAQPITDGEKIYIPFAGELAELTTVATSAYEKPNPVAATGISINTATEKELQTLTGIGAARAAAIVAERPYTNIDQLVGRQVLSQALFDDIAPELRL